MNSLTQKHCKACEGHQQPMDEATAKHFLSQLQQWTLEKSAHQISKKFEFKGFQKIMSFANAVAWIANQEGHHPDLHITFNTCTVTLTTHAISGLSENDFIMAARIDALLL